MRPVEKTIEMVKTLDVIDGYKENPLGVQELKKAIVNISAEQAEILYFQILAKVLNEKSTLLPVNVRTLPIEILNAAMHYIHMDHGNRIRGKAIKEIGEYDAVVLFSQYHVGVGSFPGELKDVVQEILKSADKYQDIHVEKATTWKNSHDNWGFQYYYKENEFPCLRVRSVSEDDRNNYLMDVIEICDRYDEPIIVSLFGPSSPEEEIFM